MNMMPGNTCHINLEMPESRDISLVNEIAILLETLGPKINF